MLPGGPGSALRSRTVLIAAPDDQDVGSISSA